MPISFEQTDGSIRIVLDDRTYVMTTDEFITFMKDGLDVLQRITATRKKQKDEASPAPQQHGPSSDSQG